MRILARHYAGGAAVEITCSEGVIESVRSANPEDQPLADWVAPALFDLQVNGGSGHDFSSPSLTVDKVRAVVNMIRRHGVGAICPTLITSSFDALKHGMAVLRQAAESDADLADALPAIHLEGPYISAEDGPRGAHPAAHVRPPDWDEFQRLQAAAGGRIRLVTLAPELPGALPFIERLVKSGVVVAIGHTAASGERIREAVRAGARLSTHLGNGCHAVLPRHENYLWEQLADDSLWASIICDGHHLPPAIMRCIIRVKTPARLILTCDASSLAGFPPGRYREWGHEIDVLPTGKVMIPKLGVMAGSSAFTDLCVRNAIRMADVSLKDAIEMASERPRRLLNLPPRGLEPGMPADFILFSLTAGEGFQVKQTFIRGQAVSSKLTNGGSN